MYSNSRCIIANHFLTKLGFDLVTDTIDASKQICAIDVHKLASMDVKEILDDWKLPNEFKGVDVTDLIHSVIIAYYIVGDDGTDSTQWGIHEQDGKYVPLLKGTKKPFSGKCYPFTYNKYFKAYPDIMVSVVSDWKYAKKLFDIYMVLRDNIGIWNYYELGKEVDLCEWTNAIHYMYNMLEELDILFTQQVTATRDYTYWTKTHKINASMSKEAVLENIKNFLEYKNS